MEALTLRGFNQLKPLNFWAKKALHFVDKLFMMIPTKVTQFLTVVLLPNLVYEYLMVMKCISNTNREYRIYFPA